MKRRITCVAIQMEIAPLAVEANLQKAEHLIKKASENVEVDLMVLPEDFATGPISANLDLAVDSKSHYIIERLKQIAIKYQIYLVAGSIITLENGEYYNTSYLFNPDGEIILDYKKNNLWHSERRYLTKGNQVPVVKTSIGVIGLANCWDLVFPEVFREMAKKGVEIVCIPSYWTGEDSGRISKKHPDANNPEAMMIDALCLARAVENECLVVYANGGGRADVKLKTKTLHLSQVGHSQICTPIYGVVAKINGNDEGYVKYSYDRNIAKDAEAVYKIRADLVRGVLLRSNTT